MTTPLVSSDVSREASVFEATRASLIRAIGDGDGHAWDEADAIYRPLIQKWLRRYGLQSNDVEDLTQDVFATLVREIGNFEHNGRIGAFRNWLRTTTFNLVSNALRKRGGSERVGGEGLNALLAAMNDPSSDLSREFDLEHDRLIIQRLLARVADQCEPRTMAIFRAHMLEGLAVRDTAKRFDVSEASVHTAKSRVMRKLRAMVE